MKGHSATTAEVGAPGLWVLISGACLVASAQGSFFHWIAAPAWPLVAEDSLRDDSAETEALNSPLGGHSVAASALHSDGSHPESRVAGDFHPGEHPVPDLDFAAVGFLVPAGQFVGRHFRRDACSGRDWRFRWVCLYVPWPPHVDLPVDSNHRLLQIWPQPYER
jgi:hypothetical protein